MRPNKFKYLRYNCAKTAGNILKKILLLSLLLSTLLFGEAKIYIGGGYAYYNEQADMPNSSLTQTDSSNAGRIKLGYGERDAYAVEFSLDYIDSDQSKYAFDVNLIKAFDWDIYVNPFVKVGFGAGAMDISNSSSETLSYGSFNLGSGLFVPFNENVDLEFSYEYKNLSYEKADSSPSTENRTSHVNIGYMGCNFRF